MNRAALTCAMLLLLAAAAPAQAQIDPQADGIGLYFDEDTTVSCLTTTAPLRQIHAYLCATRLSEPTGTSGGKACCVCEGTHFAPSWTIRHGAWGGVKALHD